MYIAPIHLSTPLDTFSNYMYIYMKGYDMEAMRKRMQEGELEDIDLDSFKVKIEEP